MSTNAVLIKIAKIAAIPAAIGTYVTVSGLTGFCPTCELVVNSVRGGSNGTSCSLSVPENASDLPTAVQTSVVTNVAFLPASTLSGETVTVGALDGYDPTRPTVIDVWATYCPPCRTLRTTLHEMDLSGVNVVAIAADRPEKLEAYFTGKPSFGHELITTDQTLDALGGVDSIPLLVFASSDGEIRQTLSGAQPAARIAEVIAGLD